MYERERERDDMVCKSTAQVCHLSLVLLTILITSKKGKWMMSTSMWYKLLNTYFPSMNVKKVQLYMIKLPGEGFTLGDVSRGTSATQSYDLICIVPKRSLLKTVIPG